MAWRRTPAFFEAQPKKTQRGGPSAPVTGGAEGSDRRRRAGGSYEQPLVAPQVSHFRQVPLRTMVKFPQSLHASPT